MRLIKNKYVILVILLVTTLISVTQFGMLGKEEVNPDAINWHQRSEQFTNGLKYFQFSKTYQHYHPGVTLMWLAGPVIEVTKQYLGQAYLTSNFLVFHTNVKLMLVVVNMALLSFLTYLIYKLTESKVAIVFLSLLLFEPFFIANTRMFHMDALFTLLCALALSSYYLWFIKQQVITWWQVVVTALLFSTALLTRSLGIGILLYVIGITCVLIYTKYIKFQKQHIVLLLSVIAFTFLLFPALWVAPITTISDIFSESARIGLRDGHNQIFFGKATNDPGLLFYPLVIFMRMSPIILFGALIYLFVTIISRFKYQASKHNYFIIYLTLFYLGYFIVMSLSSKKLDRYMLTIFPFISLLSAYGYIWEFEKLFPRFKKAVFIIICGVISFATLQVINYYPYYYTYTSPLFGSPVSANSVIGIKSFGIAVPELRDYLLQRYGQVSFGFIDTKPMRAIYSNSKVKDMRISSSSDYEIAVLAINEEFPANVNQTEFTFIKDTSIIVNGLEYWRIYVKDYTINK